MMTDTNQTAVLSAVVNTYLQHLVPKPAAVKKNYSALKIGSKK
jgi:hypothetical protein